MEVTAAEIATYLTALSDTPHRLATVTHAVEPARLHDKVDEKAWSANDIFAHMRSCADVWGKTIYAMLVEDNSTLPYIHPRQWIKKTNYLSLGFHDSFPAFLDQRNELLQTLTPLALEFWSHAALIKGRKHTVFSQVRRLALHEAEHCDQIIALLK